jgi:hypothetical protein
LVRRHWRFLQAKLKAFGIAPNRKICKLFQQVMEHRIHSRLVRRTDARRKVIGAFTRSPPAHTRNALFTPTRTFIQNTRAPSVTISVSKGRSTARGDDNAVVVETRRLGRDSADRMP